MPKCGCFSLQTLFSTRKSNSMRYLVFFKDLTQTRIAFANPSVELWNSHCILNSLRYTQNFKKNSVKNKMYSLFIILRPLAVTKPKHLFLHNTISVSGYTDYQNHRPNRTDNGFAWLQFAVVHNPHSSFHLTEAISAVS